MKKLLRPVDILKLGIAGILDIFEELGDPLGIMAQGCKELYGWVPPRYKKQNHSRVVSRSLKTGDITKVVKNQEVYLRLTSQGKENLKRDFPLLTFQKKRWDKKWRVIFYDISEKEKALRDALRRRLNDLGFGMIQRSVWITPHDFLKDIWEFIKANGLDDRVFVLEAPHLLAGDPKVLAARIWKLDELNDKYRNLLDEVMKLEQMCVTLRDRVTQHTDKHHADRADKHDTHIDKTDKSDTNKSIEAAKMKREHTKGEQMKREYQEMVRDVRSRYLEVLLKDPFLPKELLPDDWMEKEVKEKIKRLG